MTASAGTVTASATPVALPDRVMPAREPLRLLHRNVAVAPDVAMSGRYAHVRIKSWAADSTLRPGGGATVAMVVFDEHRWRAADGSGRVLSTRLPDRAGQPPIVHSTVYGAGGLRMGPDPLPTDAALLAAAMNDLHPWLIGRMAGLRAINDLTGWHTPSREQRMAMLTVLADIDGLIWLGRTTDRAGRSGVAVGYDSANARDLLILDASTGAVLAYQHTAVPRPGTATPMLPAEVYDLYLDRDRTRTLDRYEHDDSPLAAVVSTTTRRPQ